MMEVTFEEITESDIPELTAVMTRAFDDDAQKHLGQARGMDFARLTTRSDNAAMQHTARSAGFRLESATVWFEKPVQPAE